MIKGALLDVDGTVYLGGRPAPGAAEVIPRLKQQGIRILYVTNRANKTADRIAAELTSLGIPANPAEVLTSSQAAAEYLKPGSFHYIGQDGLRIPLLEAGFSLTEFDPQYVIVGLDPDLTYQKLAVACRMIRQGATFVATNMDRCAISAQGVAPGNGAIVEALRVSTDADPVVIGKPEKPIMDIALRRLGLNREDLIMVGDNLETDIKAGHNAGMKSILMLTGVSKAEDIQDIKPDRVAADFYQLEQFIASGL